MVIDHAAKAHRLQHCAVILSHHKYLAAAGLVAALRNDNQFWRLQAQRLLALVAHYAREDVQRALERAVHFGAFSLPAVRRILAATAQPRPLLEELADLQRDALDPRLCDEPIGPRPTSAYQHLLEPEKPADESTSAQDEP